MQLKSLSCWSYINYTVTGTVSMDHEKNTCSGLHVRATQKFTAGSTGLGNYTKLQSLSIIGYKYPTRAFSTPSADFE